MTQPKPQRSQPWAVRGVSPETRQAAKVAAEREGLPLGEWVDGVCRRAAVESISQGQKQQLGPTADQMVQDMAARMEALVNKLDNRLDDTNRRIETIAQGQQQAPVPRGFLARLFGGG